MDETLILILRCALFICNEGISEDGSWNFRPHHSVEIGSEHKYALIRLKVPSQGVVKDIGMIRTVPLTT